MKKRFSLLLTLLLALLTLPALADWTEGQVMDGFVVTDVADFPLLGADAICMTHQKTGAEVLLLLNEDNNRTFEITFVTPAENDMGVTHVFEHATLNGSDKYPLSTIFMNLCNQTYNTYLNASTYDVMTTYPMASMSEAQLAKYAEFYLDSCFFPRVREDKSLFDTEAWHYTLESPDAPLSISGTVYSEMQGSYSLSEAARQNFYRVMFPGSYACYCFGGDPSRIPDMTWEDVKNYHAEKYHPSNSLSVLYGNIENPRQFLTLMDSYFSQFEKKDFPFSTGCTGVMQTSTEQTFSFPVTRGTPTKAASSIYYGMLMDNVAKEDWEALDLLSIILSSPASPLTERLNTALPTADFSLATDLTMDEPYLLVIAEGLNPEDAATLRDTVNASLKEIVENGFDQEGLEAAVASFRMETALVSEDSAIGISTIPEIAYAWATTGNVHAYADYVASLDRFSVLAEDGTFVRLIAQYLLTSTRYALVTTVPDPNAPGGDLAERLEAVKAAMTEEEIAQLVAASQAQVNPDNAAEAAKYIAQLQAVTVDSLPEEYRHYEIRRENGENGVRYYNALANVDGVGQPSFMLDASGLSQEDGFWFKLLIDLAGALPTKSHTLEQVNTLVTRYLYDVEIRISVFDDAERVSGFIPYLRCTWKSTDEDLEASYALMYELLFETDFSDTKKVRNLVSYLRSNLNAEFRDSAYMMTLYRAWAANDPAYDYFTYISYFGYADFLKQVDRQLGSKPENVIANLERVAEALRNATNAVMMYSGSEKGIAAHRPAADGFLARLNHEPVSPSSYTRQVFHQREGLIVNSSVKYNLLHASMEQLGLDELDAGLIVVNNLANDMYLTPLLRDQYGVYTIFHESAEDGMLILTYADPNVDKTYAVYEQLPALLRSTNVTQEVLDGYILSAYSYYTASAGELTGAQLAILDELSGLKQERVLDYMRQIKAVTPETVAAAADLYQKLLDNGMRVTAGSKSAVYTFASLFDHVLNLIVK